MAPAILSATLSGWHGFTFSNMIFVFMGFNFTDLEECELSALGVDALHGLVEVFL